jgi:hypothetical protein
MINRTKILSLIVVLQLLVMATLAAPARAASTSVNVLPSTVTIPNVGDKAEVDVYINETELVYGYEMKIWFLLSVLNVTAADVVRPAGNFLDPSDINNQYQAKWVVDYSNSTYGMIWVAYTLLYPEDARNGTGILLSINFTGVGVGTTPVFIDYPGDANPAIISDNTGTEIPCTTAGSSVTVIPEFPVFLMLPVLAMATIVVASYTRLYRRKRT